MFGIVNFRMNPHVRPSVCHDFKGVTLSCSYQRACFNVECQSVRTSLRGQGVGQCKCPKTEKKEARNLPNPCNPSLNHRLRNTPKIGLKIPIVILDAKRPSSDYFVRSSVRPDFHVFAERISLLGTLVFIWIK